MVSAVLLTGFAQEYVLHTPEIDTQPLRRWTREHWILAGLSAFLVTSISAIVPGFAQAIREAEPTVDVQYNLPLPTMDASAYEPIWQYVKVEKRQSLSKIFDELGLPKEQYQKISRHKLARYPMSHLRTGQMLAFQMSADNKLHGFSFDVNDEQRVEMTFEGEELVGKQIERPVEHRIVIAEGIVDTTFSRDAKDAGLTSRSINQLAEIFKYDLDFVEDVKDGDRFQIIVEERWREGRRIGVGNVVGASYITPNKRLTAFAFNRNGKVEYFDETGLPYKKVLLRVPLEFARMTSSFGMRSHPVLGRMRMHKGVDYAASTGTPILAAGDAKVKFVGWKGGYGKTVELDHGQGRTTLYGHMSNWGRIKVGQRVAQGSTIGYVGSTGMSTGPHLHYEFHINGVQVNPVKVTMPKPERLQGDDLARFRMATAPAIAKLQSAERHTALAAR
jgi:murein DD-endopeptidase MepM/ murein hydrolase activator NlpD